MQSYFKIAVIAASFGIFFQQQRLMKKEQEKGGKLVSSIESLDFSVTCEEDVKIVVKDIDGWKLGSSFPMVL